MKTVLFIHLIALFLICSCQMLSSKDDNEAYIPGVYIRYSEHEFGTEYDTLVISLQNKSAHEFRIVRKWKYERVLDGVAIEPEYKIRQTTGLYDQKHKILRESQSGDMYSLDFSKKIIFKGPNKYIKL